MLVLFIIIVFIPLVVLIAQAGVGLIVTSGKAGVKSITNLSMEATVNPIKSIRRIPNSLKSSLRQIKKGF